MISFRGSSHFVTIALQNRVHSSGEIWNAAIGSRRFFGPVASLDEDCPATGAGTAFDVAGFVSDEIRGAEIDTKVPRGFEHHAGRGFSAVGRSVWGVGTKVSAVDGLGSELMQEFRVHGVVIIFGKITAPDPGLICDDDAEEPGGVQASEGINGVGENLDVLRAATVVHFLHERAVTIEEDGFAERSIH